ncbi:substrate-binding periplasmic protein [Aquipseudomonas ullengensis]|uniref:Bifunctional lytic transglycosylase/amino acid ABC transporter substrate-binding protein n=1 Tax=Aquipseudomonas ullengensis TaxID=2759166 RepID=A0A7W4LIC7_9GAMM|nr:transporter substrate-binding domain-containing protein [Pseudomonas ullengensis]MBB2493618.1 bifunctional lytic transglycosylase/amino acid ABC transporter substrate-binding protein [Pseudomonas ullengensis]
MPRTIFAALLFLLHCAGAHAQGTSTPITVDVGYYEFPPYSWTGPDGTPQGSFLKLTERLLRHAGYRGKYRAYPGARLYAGLRDGSVQLWPGAGGKPELEGHTLEARNSIGAINLALFYRPDTPPPQLPQGLAGRDVILISGYSYWKPVTDWLDDPVLGLTTHRTSTHTAALEMLQRHRGDFLIDYQSPVEQARQSLGLEPLQSTLLHRLQLRLIASRHAPGSAKLLKKLDQAYEQLQANGADLSIE